MSWLFSQALVEEYSAGNSLDGEPFAQLNVMPTAHCFWRRGKTMDVSSLSQFGLTLQVLTDARGMELLTSFLAGFHARTFLLLDEGPELLESGAGYGKSSHALLAKYDPDTHSLKTAQLSLIEDLTSCSPTLPRSGSMLNGMCFPQNSSASITSESGSGSSLPTPSGVNGGTNNTMGRVDEWGGSSNPLRGTVIGSMCLPEFEEMVMGWPITWTELMPFETVKFREWQQQHSLSLPSEPELSHD